MSKRLFCGGLAWATTTEDLREAFTPFGEVVDAKVVTDRDTGRSRGFGFVTFDTEEAANTARESMDGAQLGGRTIRVDLARERTRSSGPPRR